MVCASHILFTDMTPEVKNWESAPRSLNAEGIQQLLVHFMHKFCKVPLLKVSLCHHYCWAILS